MCRVSYEGNFWDCQGGPSTGEVRERHWLDYDPVALAVLVIGVGIIELLALII